MNNIVIKNNNKIKNFIYIIKKDWLKSLHIVSDFDWTMTKSFINWEKKPSIISVLRSEWYLWGDYSKKAYELFDYYNPIEINPDIDILEKSIKMTEWRKKHLDLMVISGLHKKDIEKVANSWVIKLREGVKDFLYKTYNKNIPFIILSANWLWWDSIRNYMKYEKSLFKNIEIVSNNFIWDENGNATWYDDRVIHTFNKWEVSLKNFPEIYKKIENRKNVILLWDSLWDINMADWFDYENILKIWFYNEEDEKGLEKYKELYDVVIIWDSDFSYINSLFDKL